MAIKKVGKKYVVRCGGKTRGTFKTRKAALHQEGAIHASKNRRNKKH